MARDRARPVNRHWTGFSNNANGMAAGTLGLNLAPAIHDRETLLRTRGQLVAGVDGVQGTGLNVTVAVGFILVPEGTSATVLWSPITDADAPWFFYSRFNLLYEEMVLDAIDLGGSAFYRETIDTKAMRRIRNQEIQMVVEQAAVSGSASINVSAVGRFLSQE